MCITRFKQQKFQIKQEILSVYKRWKTRDFLWTRRGEKVEKNNLSTKRRKVKHRFTGKFPTDKKFFNYYYLEKGKKKQQKNEQNGKIGRKKKL